MLKRALMALAVTSIAATSFFVAPPPAQASVNVYTTPGQHTVNGRQWNTTCEQYDANIERCRSDIKSGGKWVFNNLTYLATDRDNWYDNPLARPGKFTSGGREWTTSCNDDWTGKSACRTFLKNAGKWVFNNVVYFTPTTVDYPAFTFNQNTGSLNAKATPTTRYWAMGDVPLYSNPTGGAAKGFLKKGEATIITQRSIGERSEVFHHGIWAWVPTYALITEGVEPSIDHPPATGENLNKGYSSGLNGTNENTKKVIRHIWANHPAITTMYGVASRANNTSDHPSGAAVDVMIPKWNTTSGKQMGWEMARFYRTHASEFGIKYIIFDQQIWSVQRDREGWRMMENRGNNTANHKDHIHISTYTP